MAGKSSGVGVGGYLSAVETARQGACDSGRAQAVARLGEMLCEQAAARLHGGGGAPCHRCGSDQKQWQQQPWQAAKQAAASSKRAAQQAAARSEEEKRWRGVRGWRREGLEQVGSSRGVHAARQRQGDAAASRCVTLRVAASGCHFFKDFQSAQNFIHFEIQKSIDPQLQT
jgi:hypothetical protein